MAKEKHTPGPWFAEYGAAHNVIFAEQGIACIATIHHGVEPCSDANARLIAEAPAMLAALRLCQVSLCDAWSPRDRKALAAVNAILDRIDGQNHETP